MRKILVATHSNVAEGIKNSVALLTGRGDEIQCINAYMDEHDYGEDLIAFINSVQPEDEAVIFTDLYGGSVNQRLVKMHPEEKGIFVITDFNLSIVLGVLLYDSFLDAEAIDELVELSAKQMSRLPRIKAQAAKKLTEQEEESIFFQ